MHISCSVCEFLCISYFTCEKCGKVFCHGCYLLHITNHSHVGYKKGESNLETFPSGTTSTKQPRLALIPLQPLIELSERFEKGIATHEKPWNALSPYQDCLTDKKFLTARAEHIIMHAFRYIAKLNGLIPDDGDNDASAIMWGGCCLSEGKRTLAEKKDVSLEEKEKALETGGFKLSNIGACYHRSVVVTQAEVGDCSICTATVTSQICNHCNKKVCSYCWDKLTKLVEIRQGHAKT